MIVRKIYFYEVEGQMESLKRRPSEKNDVPKDQCYLCGLIIGLVILLGVHPLERVLGGSKIKMVFAIFIDFAALVVLITCNLASNNRSQQCNQ